MRGPLHRNRLPNGRPSGSTKAAQDRSDPAEPTAPAAQRQTKVTPGGGNAGPAGDASPTRSGPAGEDTAEAIDHPTAESAVDAITAAQGGAVEGQATAPSGPLTRGRLVFAIVFVIAALGGLYFLLPKLAGLNQTWGQLKHGDPLSLVLAAVFEMCSIAGYAILFRTVFGRGMPRLDWRASIEIPLAGIAAIRLLAAAGAGGVAVTVWALRRAGMASRVIACRMVASYVVQYSVYLGALIVCGFGLRLGIFSGEAPIALTTVPAVLSAAAVAFVASMALVPGDFERRLSQMSKRSGRIGRFAARFATAPATLGEGVRTALMLIRQRRIGLLGAVVYWGFDIAVLGLSFRAFGTVVPVAVVVMGYFLGTLGSLLPLPGGIGGVEGGMIGAFVAFGIPGDKAVIAVLAYRAISFWLPTLPGIIGYFALRSRISTWRMTDTEEHAAVKET